MKGPTSSKAGGGGPSHIKNGNKNKVSNDNTASSGPSKKSVQNLDGFQMSAYAVYNNLIPGVKSYEDTSESTQASLRKKSKKRKKVKLEQLKKDEASAAGGDVDSSKVARNKVTNEQPSSTTNSKPSKSISSEKDKNVAQVSNSKRRITPIPVPVVVPPTQPLIEEGGENNKQKKKRRNRKKKKTTSSNIEPEPPQKMRKIEVDSNILPNPLSNGNIRKNGEGKKIAIQQPTTASTKLPPVASMKANDEMSSPKIGSKTKKKGQAIKNSTSCSDIVLAKESSAVEGLTKFGKKGDTDSNKPPDLSILFSSKVIFDSVENGKRLFAWMIFPQSVSEFMERFWEKNSLLIKRGILYPNYYDWILSSAKLDDLLRKNVLKYTKNIDVVCYENGERITVSEDMSHRVRPAALWDYYSTGNSIRLLNPQTYCGPLRRLNAALQEMFGTFVGANVYLTPPDAQGFAPHWDDIEAFVLQIEGKKRWKLYKPRNPHEVLARYSSKDFGKEEESLGEPFIDVVLEPGDLLYFPRGIIHQAHTVDGFHSMHITISCYQQNSWADLLKEHFSKAVDKLASTDVEFRKGLPLDYLSFMGLAPSKKTDATTIAKRNEFKSNLKRLVTKVGNLEADAAADEMGKKFMWDSLPPYLTGKEKDKTVVEDGEFLNNGIVKNRVEMDPDTKVKLIRKHAIRLILEDSTLRLYYTVENPLVYHEDEPNFVEISEEYRSAVELLINSYPDYVRIEDLPIADDDLSKKIQITADLWERGILMTEKSLEAGEIDDEEDLDFDDLESLSQDSQDEDDLDDDDSDIEGLIDGDMDLETESDEEDLDMPISDDDTDTDGIGEPEAENEGSDQDSSDIDSSDNVDDSVATLASDEDDVEEIESDDDE